jgi:hypothetical protein
MPYIIKPVTENHEKGFKVCKKTNPDKCFSNHPLPKERALKQRTAIILSELGRRGGNGGGIHTGPRGGKYVLVNGEKRYVKST